VKSKEETQTMTGLIRFSPLTARALNAVPLSDFDRALGSFASQLFGDVPGSDFALRADVAETETSYIARFDVPGVAKENIAVTVEEKLVKVDVTFATATTEGEKLLRSERLAGETSRSFRFANAIDSDAATATHEHGVLTLTLPKKVLTAQKRVTIN
jgi:HSP20 family protein